MSVEVLTQEAWIALGESLYGKNKVKWRFKCAHCGHVQTPQDFLDIEKDPGGLVHFSCIGRYKQGVGCDWTLGGLFQLHEREVMDPDDRDKRIQVFRFADEI